MTRLTHFTTECTALKECFEHREDLFKNLCELCVLYSPLEGLW